MCAAGLSALLVQYTVKHKLTVVLLNLASAITTKLHQTHALFCCVCGWARSLTGAVYNKVGKRKLVLVNVARIFTTELDQMHALLCCVCCWLSTLLVQYTNNGKTKICVTECRFYIDN